MITWWDEILYQISSEIRCKYIERKLLSLTSSFSLRFWYKAHGEMSSTEENVNYLIETIS